VTSRPSRYSVKRLGTAIFSARWVFEAKNDRRSGKAPSGRERTCMICWQRVRGRGLSCLSRHVLARYKWKQPDGVQINARRHVPTGTCSLVPSIPSRKMSPIWRKRVPASRNPDSSNDHSICVYYFNLSFPMAHECLVKLLIPPILPHRSRSPEVLTL
jgi:hypothetical protein